MKNGISKSSMYEDLANTIWRKDVNSREDRIRWHSSTYHFPEKSLLITDLFEDCMEVLDIESRLVDIRHDVWQLNYLQNPLMMAAMAKVMYENLKQYNRYSFEAEPNWITEARKYKTEVLNGDV